MDFSSGKGGVRKNTILGPYLSFWNISRPKIFVMVLEQEYSVVYMLDHSHEEIQARILTC